MYSLARIRQGLRRRWHGSGKPGGVSPERDRSLAVPFAFAPGPLPPFRIGAQLHIFYADIAADLRRLLDNAGPGMTALVTTDTEAKRAAILQAFAGWDERISVRIVPNRGRDIAPKLLAFADRYDEFDLLLFLHSKKSEYGVVGEGWRELLYDTLCGSPEVVRSVLSIFAARVDAGLVFPQHHEPARPFTGWEYNFAAARRLARRMGVRLRRRGTIEFPSGSMFWARPAALAPLLRLGLRLEDFPEEGGQMDATIAHAVERLFALSAELAGLRWYKVAAPAHYRDRRVMTCPASGGALESYLAEQPVVLMETMVRG